jgi:hypothetical protein
LFTWLRLSLVLKIKTINPPKATHGSQLVSNTRMPRLQPSLRRQPSKSWPLSTGQL